MRFAMITGDEIAADEAPETKAMEEVEAIWSAIDLQDDRAPLDTGTARIRRTGAFNAALGPLGGPNGRPGHSSIEKPA
jgi:hypothetical protein